MTAKTLAYQPATGEVYGVDRVEGVRSDPTAMWKSPSYLIVHVMPFTTFEDKNAKKITRISKCSAEVLIKKF